MLAWKSIAERLPIYIYPLFLLMIEYILRSLGSLEIQPFIGPTLAAVGTSLVLPLIIRKPLTVEKLKKYPQIVRQLDRAHQQKLPVGYLPPAEITFIYICLSFIFILTGIWAVALYLSIKFPDELLWIVPSNYIPGFINYFIGVVLSEIREAV